MRILLFKLMLIACLFQGCTTYVSLHRPERILVPQINPNLDSIRQAILKGASRQGWTVLQETDNSIIITNEPYRSTRYPIIAVDYSLYAVDFHYASSFNLRYTYITDEKQLVRREYNKIVNGLVQSIDHEVRSLSQRDQF
jgi:hypothetical protein